MELADGQRDLLAGYPEHFGPLIGDRRTGRAFRATGRGSSGPRAWCPRGSRASTGSPGC